MSQPESALKQRITEDMKSAMRAADKRRLGTIRLLMAAIKQREVDERIALDDAQVIAAIEKMIKQRRDSISQYQAAGRQELADQEVYEIEVLQTYMPAALSEAEIDVLIEAAITNTGAVSAKDMGKVIAALKAQAQGRADMGKVSAKVKARLGG
ncbi:MAG TPA: GatB/YqeY domain-containing protein [Gammaproteobacteria bacterium]|nr:GatB/YqeY domain-containing protein [Gammaproteobacteria bacterium]